MYIYLYLYVPLSLWEVKICEDMKKVQKSKKTLTPTDKTSNMYRLNKNDYQNF